MTAMTTDLPVERAPQAATGAPAAWPGYGTLWKRTPGSAVYLLAIFVVAMVSITVLASLFWTGVGLLAIVIGLPIVVGTLLVARGFGVADRYLLRLTGQEPIAEPAWNRDRTDASGFWMTLTRPLRNGHYWLYLLHGMIVSPIISTITFALTVAWLSIALGGLTYWFWGIFIPRGDNAGVWGDNVAEALPWLFGGLAPQAVEVLLYLIAGIICAVTLPWVLNGLAWVHHAVAKGMLGPWRTDALAQEVRAEASARGAAVHAEDVSLRRLERDIHDGPQQRLVRLQMDLAALERRAEAGDTDSLARLAQEARGQAKAALDELRALSSGVAPPLLQDRGLAAALAALASESPARGDGGDRSGGGCRGRTGRRAQRLLRRRRAADQRRQALRGERCGPEGRAARADRHDRRRCSMSGSSTTAPAARTSARATASKASATVCTASAAC